MKTPRPHSKLQQPRIRKNALTSKLRAHLETTRSHPNLTKERAHIRNCALVNETTHTQNYALTSETARAERFNTPHRTVPCSSQRAVQCCVRAALNRAALSPNLCALTPLREALNTSKSREICNHFFQTAWTAKANITIFSAAREFSLARVASDVRSRATPP